MSIGLRLPDLAGARPPSAADQVFEAIYAQVLTLAVPPGARLSEAEVAKAAGVSRQPVRDAFWRLQQIGFLTIRPQRATVVSPISVRAVRQARFVRTALEVEIVRAAAERFGPREAAALEALLLEQAAAADADDRARFHALDDAFHRRICALAGLEFAWSLIRDTKAQMDRVRFLSLSFGMQKAHDDHRAILAAIRAGAPDRAAQAMREHLGRIEEIIARVRLTHAGNFTDEEGP
jgi:DNA-binding GntR family transcriptional regulator